MNAMQDRLIVDRNVIELAGRLAYRYENAFFGCSQTVLAALMETFCISNSDMLRCATAFAGGVARRGTACGSLSGGLMMIGLLTGRDDLEMRDQYMRGMVYADRLCKKFEDAYGSILCRDIQTIRFGRSFNLLDKDDREALHNAMRANPEGCQAVARDAARWTAEIVVDILEQGPPLARQYVRLRPNLVRFAHNTFKTAST